MVVTELTEPVWRDWGSSRGATPGARATSPGWPERGGGIYLGQWDWGSENAGMKVMPTELHNMP